MSKLILLRHGESVWNKKNVFTGWVDIPLSTKGIDEALIAGKEISALPIDYVYTSTLVRGMMTAMLAMSQHSSGRVCVVQNREEGERGDWGHCYNAAREAELIPVTTAWQLNERMYGELQGQNKDETRAQFGADQVHIWRRSFDVAPPRGESLKMTAARTLPYFDQEILPKLRAGKNILIAAHGNSLRSIVMELDQLSEEELLSLEIPTGRPLLYTYKEGSWQKDALL